MMAQVNNKYKIRATIVSPLSIGQGGEKDWVEGIDYIIDEYNKQLYLCHLDLGMMADAGIPLDQLSALFASGNKVHIQKLLFPKLDELYDFNMILPVRTSNPIKTFYYNPITEKYVLFGSSLKGAVRSALFHFLTQGEKKGDLMKKGECLNRSVFGEIKDGSDFMRFIRIGDFDFDSTELVNTKIYNLHNENGKWQGGWKHNRNKTDNTFRPDGFNTVYECLMPGSTSEGYIMISPLLFDRISENQPYKSEKDSIMHSGSSIYPLFEAINRCTQGYIEKEIAFYKEYPEGKHSDLILDSLKRYAGIVSEMISLGSKACLIKMSAGSGFHSITGDWQYDDYTNTGYTYTGTYTSGWNAGKKKYKSRKIACLGNNYTPMGFIKLSQVE